MELDTRLETLPLANNCLQIAGFWAEHCENGAEVGLVVNIGGRADMDLEGIKVILLDFRHGGLFLLLPSSQLAWVR